MLFRRILLFCMPPFAQRSPCNFRSVFGNTTTQIAHHPAYRDGLVVVRQGDPRPPLRQRLRVAAPLSADLSESRQSHPAQHGRRGGVSRSLHPPVRRGRPPQTRFNGVRLSQPDQADPVEPPRQRDKRSGAAGAEGREGLPVRRHRGGDRLRREVLRGAHPRGRRRGPLRDRWQRVLW